MAILSEHQISIGLNLALTEAEKAQQAQTYPIGAVITALDGEIIAKAHNRVKSHHDPTAHAEIEVIRSAGLFLSKNKWQGILYTTIEPCLMCVGAILAADIAVLVWGASDLRSGAVQFILKSYEKEDLVFPQIIAEPDPDFSARIRGMMRNWETSRGYSPENWNR